MEENAIDELKSAVRARMASPLFGSFAVAFVLFNWQFFYILVRSAEPPATAMADAYRTLATGWCWVMPSAIAIAYAVGSEWALYPIHLAKRHAEIYRENKLRAITDKHLHLTTEVLSRHPDYIEAKRRVAALEEALRWAWDGVAESVGANTGDMLVRDTDSATHTLKFPSLFHSYSPDGRLTEISETTGHAPNQIYCGVAAVGEHRVVCVRDGGPVPCQWDPTWVRIDFVDGRAQPVLAHAQPFRGPIIERGDKSAVSQWGIFRATAQNSMRG